MAETTNSSVTSPAIATVTPELAHGLPHQNDLDLLDLGLIAKSVCSGLFISRRHLNDILVQSVTASLPDGRAVEIDLSHDNQVTARCGALARTAIWAGDQGAILLPVGANKPMFEPRPVIHGPPTVPSMEDAVSAPFEAAVQAAFEDHPDTMTAGVTILHRGRLVAERYGAGADAQTPLEAWSMGKSLAAVLLACAVSDGLIGLDDPIALREWQDGDPRMSIRVEDALRMASGIDFSASWAEDYEPDRHGYPDHGLIYSGALDSRALTASRPLRHSPGTFGAYKNGDTLLLMAALEDRLMAQGKDPLSWPYERLLGPLGAHSVLLETDPYGHFLITGYVYGTARDWARLAQLFIDRDLANLVKADWTCLQACLQPTTAWSGKYWMAEAPKGFRSSLYGGQIWLNQHASDDRWPAPDDTAFFMGVGGQYGFLVPSLDLVIVRMGHIRGTVDTGAGRGHVPALVEAACAAARASP